MRIARGLIDADADKVVRRLSRHGFQAYLVGGCVRDLLLERTPKDFDVATSATPKETKDLFRNCRIIGRRFRLAHIFFGPKIIETATFRANPRQGQDGEEDELLIRRDNVFGTDTEDAQRRDFTINGLFYDVEAESVIDHVGGLDDLTSRVVRTIGDPDIRFREDPVRMLRAIKFAARLGFAIERDTYAAILRHRDEVTKCAPPRVLEEIYRLLRGGAAKRSMEILVETGMCATLSPQLAGILHTDEDRVARFASAMTVVRSPRPAALGEEAAWAATWADEPEASATEAPEEPASPQKVEIAPGSLPVGDIAGDVPVVPIDLSFVSGDDDLATRRSQVWKMLARLDAVFASGGEMSNAMLIAAALTPMVMPELVSPATRPTDAEQVIDELLSPLADQLKIARKDSERTRQILAAQRRLAPARQRRGKPVSLLRRDFFTDALTVYELALEVSGADLDALAYWRELVGQQPVATDEGGDGRPPRQRRRRRGGKRRRRQAEVEIGANAGYDAT
ncbi:MAG TPA: polynucleotide adenylyltransferase PcnB [Kofleriaceae bacterium]|nr:polynucleotide adenylyltransferase PcnB [Kofleriaceae bacterium]